ACGGELEVTGPFDGVVVAIPGAPAERVGAGSPLVVLEAMKMEHEVLAEIDGVVRELAVAVGDAVKEGQLLLTIKPGKLDGAGAQPAADAGSQGEREDLREVLERHRTGLDAARPDAVDRRRERGRRTARENLADLLDEGSLVEYGPPPFAP